ncbi:MAG TPA: urease accessory protein UreD [Aestuariivirga sp.]
MTMVQTLDTDLQRSAGAITLEVGVGGAVQRMREEGCAKLRTPARLTGQSPEAIIINTSGGLAGGDRFEVDVRAESDFCLTTQAAEKIYRSLGCETRVATRLRAEGNARLLWLPQEAILFNGAQLKRSFDAELDRNATLLAVETVVLGRKAMGESLTEFSFHDHWRIRRNGKLIFSDDLRFDPMRVRGAAALGGREAFATIVLAGRDTELFLEPLREIIGMSGGVSAWDGKLIARLVGADGFDLRKTLIPALKLLSGKVQLPKVWTL